MDAESSEDSCRLAAYDRDFFESLCATEQARNVAVPAPCLLVGVVVIGWLCEGMRATTNTTLRKIRGFIAGFLLHPLLKTFLRALLLRLRMVWFRALGFGNGRSSVPKLVYRASSKPWQHELAESIPAVDCPNCSAHAEPYLPRLHMAMQRIYFTREEGRCGGRDAFDP